MTDKKPRPGDDCPKCGTKLEVRQGMFHFRGLDFEGLVCGKCKALWTNPDKPTISDATAEAAAHPDGPAGFCCVCKKTTIHTCSDCEIMESEAGHNVGPPRWLCGSEECAKTHEHMLRTLRLKGGSVNGFAARSRPAGRPGPPAPATRGACDGRRVPLDDRRGP